MPPFRILKLAFSLSCSLALVVSCSSSNSANSADNPAPDDTTDDDSSGKSDAGKKDASSAVNDSGVDKAANCADTFGTALTNSFGRLDGTVVAVVPPAHPTCAGQNGTHVVVQVKMKGDVYRMVVNVQSDFANDAGSYDAYAFHTAHDLVGPPWADGWHTDVSLDYATDLNAHRESFTPGSLSVLTQTLTDAITIGSNIRVYATSSGGSRADSAHLVHRNGKTKTARSWSLRIRAMQPSIFSRSTKIRFSGGGS